MFQEIVEKWEGHRGERIAIEHYGGKYAVHYGYDRTAQMGLNGVCYGLNSRDDAVARIKAHRPTATKVAKWTGDKW